MKENCAIIEMSTTIYPCGRREEKHIFPSGTGRAEEQQPGRESDAVFYYMNAAPED